MKAVTVTTIKKELQHLEKEQLVELALRITKYKIENKELMTYLLFEEHDEDHFIEAIKAEMDDQFEDINTTSYHFIKKSVRKILRGVKKHVRYSKKLETEAALTIHFCRKLKQMDPSYRYNTVLTNMYERQLGLAEKIIDKMHEDLQYDYKLEIEGFS